MNTQQYISIIQELELAMGLVDYLADSTGEASLTSYLSSFIEQADFDEDQEKILALMEAIDVDYSTALDHIEECDYYVYTDKQADDAWDESLDHYLDDCILPDLPESVQYYFDRDSWKSDARMDGRSHSLAHYDGEELEATINGTTYYIFRCN